jgi:hypothetical protein
MMARRSNVALGSLVGAAEDLIVRGLRRSRRLHGDVERARAHGGVGFDPSAPALGKPLDVRNVLGRVHTLDLSGSGRHELAGGESLEHLAATEPRGDGPQSHSALRVRA